MQCGMWRLTCSEGDCTCSVGCGDCTCSEGTCGHSFEMLLIGVGGAKGAGGLRELR